MRLAAVVLGVTVALAVSSCTATAPRPTAEARSSTPTPVPMPDPIAGMSLEQQVGQLFMVGTTAGAAEPVTLRAISELHVGNVFLAGRSHLGVAATARVVGAMTARVTAASTDGEPLLVATDQEGGEVQVLSGPGFLGMPTGVAQGGMTSTALGSAAKRWGSELDASGVNMNLAPVVDLIPSPSAAPGNPPIGAFRRELGFSPSAIESHADAFRTGMSSAHVVTVLKHFPGLGHVTQNTDTAHGVTDGAVAIGGPDLDIYRTEIAAGAQCVMVSSAIYSKLDASRPAVFSPTVVTGLLRNSLGFRGVVISDDLSGAAQITGVAPGDRAIDAIAAGVDIILISSRPDEATAMVAAVLAKAEADPAFAVVVASAARRVVELKDANLPPAHRAPAVGLPSGTPVAVNNAS